MRSGLLRSIALAALVGLPAALGHAWASEVSQDTVKAGFLFNFAQFAAWPEDGPSDRPLVFCVDRDDIDQRVFKGWTGATIGARPTRIDPFGPAIDAKSLADCDLIYAGAAMAGRHLASLRSMADREHILLVSNLPGFARAGGHIELYLAANHFRFRINLSTLRRSGVEVSSKVLRLAEIVNGEGTR